MSLSYAYTPQIWPSVLMVLLMITLSLYCGRRRSVPGATPLMITSLFAAAWAAGILLETAAVDLATKIFWFKVQAVIQLPIITGITCFILEYTWPGRWLTRRNLALLFFPILLFVGLILTNDRYHLAWRGFSMAGTLHPIVGPGSWLIAAYFFGVLGSFNLVVFAWMFLRSPRHRWPVVLMLVGQLAGRTLFLLDKVAHLQFLLPLDLFGMSFEFLMYAIVLFGFRIFDPIPLARQTAIEQLQTGMLVLDPQNKIIGLNTAACTILGSPQKHLLGRLILDLLPACAGLIGNIQAGGKGQGEISLGSAPETRYYQVNVTALNDWRGLVIGHLLMMHDITEQKRVQSQLIEQQRALAMLQEREQLARELHDDLGQVLAFISTQGQVVQQLVEGGDVTRAGSCIARLVEVADEADTDIRESILSLRAPFSGQGLIPTLQDYLRRYEGRYGLHVELLLPECGLENAFEPVSEVQILRILQEGLTNARKHASASCLQVAFAPHDGQIQIAIRDDGKGFEPGNLQDDPRRGFGLQFMRERAEAIGGSLELRSAKGKGTEVLLVLPMKESDA